MLKHLTLKNLVLIDSCHIEFGKGLTILSGETGAGKSALIEAIGLACGQRADSSIIRKGFDKAVVEAAFEIDGVPLLIQLLEDSGITLNPEESLVIRREISREGKNRAFLNCQMAPLPVIQKIGSYLIDLIGQHAQEEMRTIEAQRAMLDLYADTRDDLLKFQQAWQEEKIHRQKLENFLFLKEKKEREIELCSFELQELEMANIQEGEEDQLFDEYQRLSHTSELMEKIQDIYQGLSESSEAIIPHLSRYKNLGQSLTVFDPSLKEPVDMLSEAFIALSEAARHFNHYLDKLENDPSRLAFLDERLKEIHRIKRKYSAHFSNLNAYILELKKKLSHLENLDHEIEAAREALSKADAQTINLSQALTKKRKAAAQLLSAALSDALQSFNMAGAHIEIRFKPQARTMAGEDLIELWLQANVGEPAVLVKEGASGGELSRLILAIKTTLAEKNHTPIIVFDEIDGNVGGETAVLIGKKLRELGKFRQVLCITHFPQVARFADHHFRVVKEEKEGRTFTSIEELNKKERESELLRMLGGKKVSIPL